MEPGWLQLLVPTGLVTGLFMWSFGAWRNATANAVLAWVGLVVTVLGAVLTVTVIPYPGRQAEQVHGAGSSFGGCSSSLGC